MVHETKSAAEHNMSDIHQFIKQDPSLLLTATSGEAKYITVARQVVLKGMHNTSVLVFTQTEGLVYIITHENVAKNHTYMTAKGIKDV